MKEHRSSEDLNFQYGRWLASPPPGEEVVISGMSARLPESHNIHEFRDNLFAKKEMVTDDDRRWKVQHSEIIKRTAKIFDIDKFDAGYFGVHYRQADSMDAMMRGFIETAIEAIMDAGVNPSELEGSRTAVLLSNSWSDAEHETLFGITEPQKFAITGYLRTIFAHRVGYFLKLKAAGYNVESACSSFLNTLDAALKSIRSGQCDNVIVGAAHLLLHPGNTLQFFRLGILSRDGICKIFDQSANGYVRAETIGCLFLQKAKNSRRIYARVIASKVNCDGFKKEGILFPSTKLQEQLLREIYEESNIDPSELSYLEAHGTGTTVGDPEEAEAIDCALAKRRDKVLLVGSVKSSVGHAEPASGVASIVKVLIAMETGIIAPNINLKQLKKGMKGFEQGRMKVVTELTELEGDDAIVGISNFGFGGNNSHVILRRFNKLKIGSGVPEDDIPRLVCVSGRTEESVLKLLNDINTKSLEREYIGLLHKIYEKDIKNHLYRGFTIVSKRGCVKSSVKFYVDQKSSLYVFFGQLKNTLNILGSYLTQFPVFLNTLSRVNKTLGHKKTLAFDELIKSDTLGLLCVQIGVVDILKVLEITPSNVYCDSYGQLACAYYHGVISLEEAVFARTKLKESNFDFLNYDHVTTSAKNSSVLNISDSHLNNKDKLLVEDGTVMFLDILGRLYEQGHNLNLHKLYPEIEFPVSRGTPMVSPLIDWDHDKEWHTYNFDKSSVSNVDQKEYNISIAKDQYKFVIGHVIDDRNLFPATGYLYLVWQTYAQTRNMLLASSPVIFKNCKFVRAATIPKSGSLNLLVSIQRGSGDFEILENESLMVSGTIEISYDINKKQIDLPRCELKDDCKETLDQDEIYRELYLRGYSYRGMFKGITKCNVALSCGLIKWENNWTTFMDNMLQIRILQGDARLLNVPVNIKKLSIDPVKHLDMVAEIGEQECLFPVYVYNKCNIIKSGGIEICGLEAKSISRKKPQLEPVLEKYEFVPNSSSLELSEAIRTNVQIILENTLQNQFKAVEIIDDNTNTEPLMFLVSSALDDVPVVTPDLTISTRSAISEEPGVKVADVTLTSDSNLHLIIGTNLLQFPKTLKQLMSSLDKKGFILTREESSFTSSEVQHIDILTQYKTPNEKLILFRKSDTSLVNLKFVEVSSQNYEWFPILQQFLKTDHNVIIYSRNEKPDGILGFINCIRREPNGGKIKCFFMMDEAPVFDPNDIFYNSQIRKNMAINVYENKTWGTYRHLRLEDPSEIECEHCYSNVTVKGDLSSFKWLEGPLRLNTPLKDSEILVSSYYSAINFKDIMTASGRIGVEGFVFNRLQLDCLLGFEFAGRDSTGRRVAGMVSNRALSSLVAADGNFLWEVPDSWSLEDAATVPVVYSTVLCALLVEIDLKPSNSILIHSATGGVGLAALNVCLHYKCDIYVTVGTAEKRDFLIKHYPQIPPDHIGNSRDISFEEMIKTQTRNRGVDIVLNSLADDKLKASVRCLARGGHFLEIGKFDSVNDTSLDLLLMERGVSYHGVMLDKIQNDSKEMKGKVVEIVNEGIRAGFVKPLPRIVFGKHELEEAHRYMMTGKHIGKVLVKIRNEEETKMFASKETRFRAVPRFWCYSQCSYIIIGGLGGVGLELVDWLVLRGATKLVLVSRSGIQNGYQKQRIQLWKSYCLNIKISICDIATKRGCIDLIKEAEELGPVDGIFNLAVLLKDALFEDQTEESFLASYAPKAQATIFLDEITREMCPNLRYFVVFSSVSCGRGNAGQTNYGMANSVMERICEKRKIDGIPAVAIQWGAIGDVGLVAKMQKENRELIIGGTLQQKISSCLDVLDRFLKQKHPVVSSIIVAEKHKGNKDFQSAVDAVAHVIGIKNLKTVSQHATFSELGMDSMMSTEISQLLEKDFDIYFTNKEVRNLTLAKLQEIEAERGNDVDETNGKTEKVTNMLVRYFADGSTSHLQTVQLPSQAPEDCQTIAFILTGMEGDLKTLEPFAKQLKAHVIGIPYSYYKPEESIEQIAKNIASRIENKLHKSKHFCLIGYSFGVIVGLEVVKLLENEGYRGEIVAIDGSPTYVASTVKHFFPNGSESENETALICQTLSMFVSNGILEQYKNKLLQCANLNDRVDLAFTLIPPEEVSKQKLEKQGGITLYKRFKALKDYEFNHQKIKSDVHLFKAKYSMIDEDEDYQLSKICEKAVHVTSVNGDHVTILNQPELVTGVNQIIQYL